MVSKHALHVSASFFDTVVEDTFADRGEPLEIGNTDVLAVPVPRGAPYVAKATWSGKDRVTIVDGRGRAYTLGPDDEPLELRVGPVTLHMRLVARYSLRRSEEISVRASLTWLAIVLMATITAQQAELLARKQCQWFGINCPVQTSVENGPGGVTAEYLARLLKEDYAGSENGSIERQEREEADKQVDSFYLPAGNEGPVTDMGGAAETAPEPVRTPPTDEEPVPEQAPEPEEQAPLAAPESEAEPVVEEEPVEEPDDGIVEVESEEAEEPEEEVTPPAEDKEGWGLPDWYDATDKALDELEIEAMLRVSKERLRIDPDDPEALSILSYYQYLAEDYSAAEKTYDRYIELYPESSAGYNNKALVYKRRGEYQKEEGLYRVALALKPRDVTALNNLAVNLAHQGKYDEAIRIMEELETLDPDEPYADLHRAKIFAGKGDHEQALFFLDKALAGMADLDTLHHIEFRQDIRLDPAFDELRNTERFRAILLRYYGNDSPLEE